ncbi:MAG: response regulator [Myxococcota bacterium]
MKVLVVEDEDMVARSMIRALKMHGHQAERAVSVEEARRILQSGPFDALICDMLLGRGGNGLELISWAHSEFPALRCVLATAANTVGFVEDPPTLRLLRKPFNTQELHDAITRP